MTDQEIVKALIGRDSRVTAQFFFKDCRPLMLSIIHRVFDKQKVDYDEMISELYIYLMANDARRLRQFKFESTLYQWLKTTAIRFCLKLKTDGIVIDNESQEPLDNRSRNTENTESSQAKMDINALLRQMRNQRYAKVIRMLMIDDMTPDVAYINYDRAEGDKVKLQVYDAEKKRFVEENEYGYPSFLHIRLTDSQHQKLARYLSNTRPDTMGPETLQQINGLKRLARVMRFMTNKKRAIIAEQMRPMIEQGVPSDMPQEERDKMVNNLLEMYSDPKAIMAYANDAVFKDEFWKNISYQTNRMTAAFWDCYIDVDTFLDTPMAELTKFKDENLRIAAESNSQIKLKGNKYYVGEGKKRYLWLATRMGMPTVKDAPGIEVVQTYNLLTHDQIVGMVMKKMI